MGTGFPVDQFLSKFDAEAFKALERWPAQRYCIVAVSKRVCSGYDRARRRIRMKGRLPIAFSLPFVFFLCVLPTSAQQTKDIDYLFDYTVDYQVIQGTRVLASDTRTYTFKIKLHGQRAFFFIGKLGDPGMGLIFSAQGGDAEPFRLKQEAIMVQLTGSLQRSGNSYAFKWRGETESLSNGNTVNLVKDYAVSVELLARGCTLRFADEKIISFRTSPRQLPAPRVASIRTGSCTRLSP